MAESGGDSVELGVVHSKGINRRTKKKKKEKRARKIGQRWRRVTAMGVDGTELLSSWVQTVQEVSGGAIMCPDV